MRPSPYPLRKGGRVLAAGVVDKGPARARWRAAAQPLCVVGLGLASLVLCLIGAGRSFSYDAAIEFGYFVGTPSVLDPFGRTDYFGISVTEITFTNHLLIGFVSHLIYSLTGSHQEAVYRLLPAAAAAATVALSTRVLMPRFGLIAAACGGAFLAANPLFLDNSRDLRGYSLMTLLALVATLLLLRLSRPEERRNPWLIAPYMGSAAAAVVAHPFAVFVLLGHLVLIAGRAGVLRLSRLGPAVAGAGVLGGLAYAGLLPAYLAEAHSLSHSFNPLFPVELALYLLGAPYLLVAGVWLATAGLGVWAARREPALLWLLAALVLVVAGLWLVVRPTYLYPRFFDFLLPGCAFLIAAAVKRWVVLAPLVVAGAAVAVFLEAPSFTQDQLALRPAARVLDQAAAEGRQGCIISKDDEILRAYTVNYRVIHHPEELSGCDLVVVASWNVDLATRDQASADFPYVTRYDAWYPAVVLSRRPLSS